MRTLRFNIYEYYFLLIYTFHKDEFCLMFLLNSKGSIDAENRLVLRGKYVPKYIESLLRKYIIEYVACHMCRSPNTTLSR